MCAPLQTKTEAKPKTKHSVKEILGLYRDDYMIDPKRKLPLTDHHFYAMNCISCCQTARLGVYRFGCDSCTREVIMARSCKHRFCSNCGNADTIRWITDLTHKLPNIKHHHVVFTLPGFLRGLSMCNKRIVHNILFAATKKVIQRYFKKEYGLQPGLISVLHTNGSDLKYHPHIHMIVSAGGLDIEGNLRELVKDYLCPQRVMGKLIRAQVIKQLSKVHASQPLTLPKGMQGVTDFKDFLNEIADKYWIVNIDKPIKGVDKLISYVGRYTRRSCISERRLLSICDGRIKFSYKDYKNSTRGEKAIEAVADLSATDFLDRLFTHLPEKGFKMVRHYGLYHSTNLNKIPDDKKIAVTEFELQDDEELDMIAFGMLANYRRAIYRRTGKDPLYCYECQEEMKLITLSYHKDGQIIEKFFDSD